MCTETWRRVSAAAMLASGVGLTIAGFVVPPLGEVSDSVLLVLSQCLVYAGAALGVDVIIDHKIARLKDKM